MADEFDQLRAALEHVYALRTRVGVGGMATVYLAHDLKHDRDVAIKVLKPDLSAAIGTDRFLHEIRITARLNHPHILPLIDSGEVGGILYYVMPYVTGGSLRQRLNTEHLLALGTVVPVVAQVAAALDHAHQHDVVHRDIKPENILFSEGLAIVADFGIARAVTKAGGEALTRSGFPLGTPGYMSPEQAAGATNVGPPTDVFGLACVTYEMLVGETPEMWPTEEAVHLGRFVDASAEHLRLLDALPGRLQQVLVKALAIRPADRWVSPGEFAAAFQATSKRSAMLPDHAVRSVLRRGAELDAAASADADALSIGAVEQAAAQAGIPPNHVREALDDLVADRNLPASRGGTQAVWDQKRSSMVVEHVVDHEARASLYPVIADLIQTHLGITGHTSVLGSTLTWSPAVAGFEARRIVVTVASQKGHTRIHVEERFEVAGFKMVFPAWGAAVGALSGFGLAALLGTPGIASVIPAALGAASGGLLTAKAVIHVPARRRRAELETLAQRIGQLLEP